jgi:hypothetical protein
MAAGLAYCLAVITFNPGDPSLNKASDEPVRNLLGKRAQSSATSCCRASVPGWRSAWC